MAWVNRFSEAEREKILKAAKITLSKPEGKRALDYLLNVRKLSAEVIDQFDFGYCPLDVDHQMRGRIITPIYDAHGNLVVLSTRHIDESRSDKFWHETFNKGSYVYGLNRARKSIIRSNKVIIVEGEIDVTALHSRGFSMTVGMCGSALTLFQVALLSKYCSFFYLMFDDDTAGKRAIARAMEMYEEFHLSAYNLKFIPVHLEKGYDPDEFIKKCGRRKVRERLIEAKEEYGILV